MKPRLWIPLALVAVALLSTALLVHAVSPRPSSVAAGAVVKESPGSAPAADPFAAKRRPLAAKGPAASTDRADRIALATEVGERLAGFAARAASKEGDAPRALTVDQRAALDDLKAEAGPDLVVHWDDAQALPVFITGLEAASPVERDPRAAAALFMDRRSAVLRVDAPSEEFAFTRATRDPDGSTHLRYQQMYRGVEVWGRDIVVHVTSGGRVRAMNGRYAATPRHLEAVEAVLTPGEAAAIAARALEVAALEPGAAPRLVVAPRRDETLRLAWLVEADLALDARWLVFVDAVTGDVIRRVSRVAEDGPVAGSGLDLTNTSRTIQLYQIGAQYYMFDCSKPMWNAGASSPPQTLVGAIRLLNANQGQGDNLYFVQSASPTSWTSFKNAVSASYFIGKVYDYYQARHARNSIDGAGGNIEVVVNLGSHYNNAFWNGAYICFGNGDNQVFSDLAGGLDIAGHELTHGVVENTANLVYEFQPGALNESYADVFGTAIEYYVRGEGGGNWLIGEDVTTPATPGDCLRDMENPAAPHCLSQQPTRMSEYQNLSPDEDNGGVHVNSGIPNRAAFLAAQAITRAKVEQIWYRALNNYLTRSSKFVDLRLAAIQAANDLYPGSPSPEAAGVAQAFTTVGILDGTGTETPPDRPPVDGTQWIAMTATADGYLNRTPTDFSTFEEITSIPLVSKPSFTDNGEYMLFVGADYNIYAARSDGTEAAALSSSGDWSTVAVAANLSKVALTTAYVDSSIYVIDLDASPPTTTRYYLESMAQDGTEPRMADYADFVDFSLDKNYILFDAAYVSWMSGSPRTAWDISILRLADGTAFRVLPTQAQGTSVGNPVYASNGGTRIAFDHVSPEGVVHALGANLETGEMGIITYNGHSPARPCFSTDDGKVVYHYINPEGHRSVWVVSMDPDGVTGAGDDEAMVANAFDPVWFTVGQRTAVTLAYFEADDRGPDGEVRWGVLSETDHAGYNLYRADGGERIIARRITEPAARGAVIKYRFTDRTARGSANRSYILEAVDRSGRTQRFGPITARPVAEPGVAGLAPPAPNPFTRRTSLVVSGLGRASVRVFDASGRLVREIWRGDLAGPLSVRWEGDDDAGRQVGAGIYFARLECGGITQDQRLVKLR